MGDLIGGIASIGSSIVGGLLGSNANSNAASAQTSAYNNATALQAKEWQQEQQNEAPYMQAGSGALSQLSTLYGLNSAGSTGSYTNAAGGGSTVNPNASFYLSPDYNFALTQGLKGLTAQGAATNGTDNGATQKAEISYAGNLASGQYDNYKSGLMSLAGLGQSAASSTNAATSGTSANESSLTAQNGSNLASSYLGQGTIDKNLTSSLGGALSQYGPAAYNYFTQPSNQNFGQGASAGYTNGTATGAVGGYTPATADSVGF